MRKWGATWEGETQVGCLPRGRMGVLNSRGEQGRETPGGAEGGGACPPPSEPVEGGRVPPKLWPCPNPLSP